MSATMDIGGPGDIRQNITFRSLVKDLKSLPYDRLREAECFINDKILSESAEEQAVDTNEAIAQTIAETLKEKGVTLIDLKTKEVSKAFWPIVLEKLKDRGHTAPSGKDWTDRNHLNTHIGRNKGIYQLVEQLLEAGSLEQAMQTDEPKTEPPAHSIIKPMKRSDTRPAITKEHLDSAIEGVKAEMKDFVTEAMATIETEIKTMADGMSDQIESRIREQLQAHLQEQLTSFQEAQKLSETTTLEDIQRRLDAMESTDTTPSTSQELEGFPPLAPAPPLEGRKFIGKREPLGITIDAALMEKLKHESKARGVNLSRMIDSIVWTYFHQPLMSFQQDNQEEEADKS
jgi:hypothetical protein